MDDRELAGRLELIEGLIYEVLDAVKPEAKREKKKPQEAEKEAGIR